MNIDEIREFVTKHTPLKNGGETYDYNASTGKYHRQNCKYHGNEITHFTLAQIKEFGATPCGVCKPPRYD